MLCGLAVTGATVLPLVAGFSGVLKLAFPALAFAAAVVLYLRDPAGYLTFAWWIWFVTPLVRRLVDYHVGWTPVSTIMLTPYLVSMVALVGLLRHVGNLATTHLVALCLTVSGIAYAYVIGAGTVGSAPATFALLTWLVPVLFGFALAANWRRYELWREATVAAFRYGIIVTAAYGVIQFVLLPPWDAYWMQQAEMASIGLPMPFAVRVFSTFNAPGVFAIFLMTGLLVGFSHRAKLRHFGALPLVWLGFLLSQVRSAWLGYGVGLIMLMVRIPLGRKRQAGGCRHRAAAGDRALAADRRDPTGGDAAHHEPRQRPERPQPARADDALRAVLRRGRRQRPGQRDRRHQRRHQTVEQWPAQPVRRHR